MQVEHVTGIGFTARRPLQDQRDLPVGHGVLGQVVVDDQRVHAVVHEPLAHRRAGKRRQVLVGGGIGRRGRNDDGVGHRPGFLEHGDDPRDGRLLLTDRHVNAIERAVVVVACRLGGAVEARLADDGVDADRGLARRPVADDQLALTAADRNHGVDRHDAGLHRLADRTAADDAGSQLLDRIGDLARDRDPCRRAARPGCSRRGPAVPCRPAPAGACRSCGPQRPLRSCV